MKGTITKHRKKNGRISWGYYYKTEGRQFTKSGFGTKFEASKALRAALANREDRAGLMWRDDSRTVADYISCWLDNHAALRCQPKTLERYRQLADYLIRLLGGVPILALTPAAIQEAVNALLLRGASPPKLTLTDGRSRP